MTRRRLRAALALVAAMAALASCRGPTPEPSEPRVVLVTIDGLRWQEVFRGADTALMTEEAGGVRDAAEIRERFWRASVEERRAALMPFLWETVAAEGTVYGNADVGGAVRVTNGRNFSYPGYQELLAGYPDDRIDSNAKRNNPNVTVLEWLEGRPGFEGRVAAFGSWDVFPYILNADRSGVPVNAGWAPISLEPLGETQRALNQLMATMTPEWSDVRYDAVTYQAAKDYLARAGPRVLYVAFDGPDSRAHERRYDRYLGAAHHLDAMVADLWRSVQSDPASRDRTTLIITSDHGRGGGAADWTSHGEAVSGAEYAWLAILRPGRPGAGVAGDAVTLGQTAATVADAVGEDYAAAVAAAHPALP